MTGPGDDRWGPVPELSGHRPPPGTPLLGGEFHSPVMALRENAVLHNVSTMAQYCRDRGVELAPHGKTTMSPELFRLQIEAGAWGITAATGAHVRTYRRFGVSRIFLANELVDPVAIRFVASELATDPEFELICYVDSADGVDILETELAARGGDSVRLDVVVELGVPGGRTGCRSGDEALAVARRVAEAAHLRLRGVSGYEGAVGGDRSEQNVAAVTAYCAEIRGTAERMAAEGLLSSERPAVVSAGGSLLYDLVADSLAGTQLAGRPAQVLLRSGAYVTHDHGMYQRTSPFEQPGSAYRFEPALQLWGRVLSRPEPELAVADFGRRDAPFDQGYPIPLETRAADGTGGEPATDLTVTQLNDQHAFVRVPADRRLAPGSWLGCGISHPCTAFDKWRAMPVVDDEGTVVGGIETHF
ncbi:D-serine deaminase-like pyridoxal phosphate-dependent protein [Haloactinopolyspora alba]|uniref:D-serine deaminase-like pyridoxal phosphate-dependent protein n=1 Tax=Haloactinopolyspora alba TaxID=648780 RepID=A0A2P8DT26_9ACTN|nr:alanine racemase [Haloactinopolyspora alba]PSL00370.1 D-serine deaminase-like pyridoxal phosphate-dependent protein [Haloactinopolyspora alba]